MYRELTSKQSSINVEKKIILKKIGRLEEKIKKIEEEILDIENQKKKIEERPEELMGIKATDAMDSSSKRSALRSRNIRGSIEGRSSIRLRRLYSSMLHP